MDEGDGTCEVSSKLRVVESNKKILLRDFQTPVGRKIRGMLKK